MNTSARRAYIALGVVLASIASVALAATFQYFSPATGILKGNASTYVTTAAASSDVISLWTGTCNGSSALRGDGTCGSLGGGTVTSVGLTMPSGLSVAGSPVTTSGTLAVTTTLNGPVRGNGSGLITGNTSLTTEVSGVLPVANGGIGVGTLTGIALGNGTSPFTAAASANVIGLWSGTCNASSFLRGDGSCASPGGAGTVTSVTAGAGLSASPNPITASGTMSLDLTSANTWTGQQTLAAASAPMLSLSATSGGTDAKNYLFRATTAATTRTWQIATATDAAPLTVSRNWISGSGVGLAASGLTFGNSTDNTSFTFQGTGTTAFNGNVTVVGSSVCRADGTNCPVSLGGTNTWTANNNFTGGLQSNGNSVPAYGSSIATGTIVVAGAACSVSSPIGMSSSCTYNGLGRYTVAFTVGISSSKCTAAQSDTVTPAITVFGFDNTFSNLIVGAQNAGGAVDPPQFHVICIG